MRITSEKIDVNTHNFDTENLDIFKTKKFGNDLSLLINKSREQEIIALNGNWGVGKTHFLKMWVGQHNKDNSESRAIYFDAFKNDFLKDPLTGLLISIESEKKSSLSKAESKIERISEIAPKVLFPAARIIASLATLGQSESVEKIVEAISGETDALDASLWKAEKDRAAQIENLRSALDDLGNDVKIIFVIDELDRCRPDYALELLEVIKHFFDSENIHFIFGVNLLALAAIVQTKYGDSIDSSRYLQKFFKSTISLPNKDPKEKIRTFFESTLKNDNINNNLLLDIASELLSYRSVSNEITLRDIERIVKTCKWLHDKIRAFYEVQFVYVFFIIMQIQNRSLYSQIMLGSVKPEQISDRYFDLFLDRGELSNNDNKLDLLESCLVMLSPEPITSPRFAHAKDKVARYFGHHISDNRSFLAHNIIEAIS